MSELFSAEYWLLWALLLGLALFFPVRNLIFVLQVRRAEREAPIDEAQRAQLRRRAGITAGLLCFVFSMLYTNYLFNVQP